MRRRAGLSSTTVRQGSRRRYRLIVTCCGYCAPPRGWTGCRARLVELGMALYGKHGAFGANAALSRRAEKSKKRALSRQCDCAGAGVRPYARRCTPKVLVCGCSGCSCGAAWLWLGCLLGWAGLSRVRSANFLGRFDTRPSVLVSAGLQPKMQNVEESPRSRVTATVWLRSRSATPTVSRLRARPVSSAGRVNEVRT